MNKLLLVLPHNVCGWLPTKILYDCTGNITIITTTRLNKYEKYYTMKRGVCSTSI